MFYIDNMKTYYVYQLNEKTNKHRNPYIGMTDNLQRRAKEWQYYLKLDYIPELIVLHTDTSMQRTFDWEQNKRVEWGWRREPSLRHQQKMRKKGAEAASKSEKVKNVFKEIGKKSTESGQLDAARLLSNKAKAVFTKEQADQIIKEYTELDNVTMNTLAQKYGVGGTTIWRIVNRKQNIYKD